jgi:uncharacterized peroxidase-related enzyme
MAEDHQASEDTQTTEDPSDGDAPDPEVPATTRFPVPDREDLPTDVRERIDAEEGRAGFVPNVFLAYARRPEQFRAFFEYYDALLEGSLSREEVEMVVVTVSGVNDCHYCTVAHGALLRLYGSDPLLAEQLAANHRQADLSERHRAMLDLAVRLTEAQATVDDAAVAAAREAGLSREEVWDVGAVTSFFNLSNRMAQLADMRPNAEFYSLGR